MSPHLNLQNVPSMVWPDEPGFENFISRRKYVWEEKFKANSKLRNYNRSLDVVIVDACVPDQYQQNQTILVTNNWIDPSCLISTKFEKFPDSWYSIYSGEISIESLSPSYKFNCFINRMDPIRQSWLYQLIRRGVFDQGLISFNMDISRHKTQGQCLATDTPQMVFEQQFHQYLSIFQSEHQYINSQVPYRNFEVTLNQAIMQSKFSVVLETYFDKNNIITFSEKIFRCLKLPRPWLLFAMKNSVQYLRNLGFDVLDDLVDHSYDTVDFSITRQVEILNQIEIMCKANWSTTIAARCEKAALHNQQLLFKLSSGFHSDIESTFNKAISKCLQL